MEGQSCLPRRSGDEGGDDVGGMPVQAGPCPVVAHGGERVGVGRGFSSAARNIGPSVRSPVARSIAPAVRGASGMVTTLPPLRVMTRGAVAARGYRRPPETQSRSNQVVRRSEDPHRWIQAQSTVSSGISGSTPRDAIARIQPVRDSDRTAPLADYCPLPATPPAATKPSVRTGSGTRSSQISRQ